MSTRANIILKEGNEKLYFYRHSDGYPSGTLPSLNLFLNWLKSGKIRTDLQQSSGWLIVIGAIEYTSLPKYKTEKVNRCGTEREELIDNSIEDPKDWKVGAYEPTTGLHGDIEFLYTIDLNKKEIKVQSVSFNYETHKHTFYPIEANEKELMELL